MYRNIKTIERKFSLICRSEANKISKNIPLFARKNPWILEDYFLIHKNVYYVSKSDVFLCICEAKFTLKSSGYPVASGTRTDVCMYVWKIEWRNQAMKNQLDGLPFFLKYGAPLARAFGPRGSSAMTTKHITRRAKTFEKEHRNRVVIETFT